MLLNKLLEDRPISDPAFLHLIHSFQEESLSSRVYHPLSVKIGVYLLVYDMWKLLRSQGSKVIQLVTCSVALPQV